MIAYFDCYSGVSGDMTLGALVDAGADPEALKAGIAGLGLSGYDLSFERMESGGITGTRALVRLDPAVDQPHRHLSDILGILDASSLRQSVKQRAGEVFRTLGRAEATVHGVQVDHVHFHEVGAVDALVDVVGAVAGLEMLGVREVYASTFAYRQGDDSSRPWGSAGARSRYHGDPGRSWGAHRSSWTWRRSWSPPRAPQSWPLWPSSVFQR